LEEPSWSSEKEDDCLAVRAAVGVTRSSRPSSDSSPYSLFVLAADMFGAKLLRGSILCNEFC